MSALYEKDFYRAYQTALPQAEKEMNEKIQNFYRTMNVCFTCKEAMTSEWYPSEEKSQDGK